jgi:hypothetical protein
MSSKSIKNKTTSRWANLLSTSNNKTEKNKKKIKNNKTEKNKKKVCDLGINGTAKPCCDKHLNGSECHIKPSLLDNTKRLTRNDTIKIMKEHDDYKYEEAKMFGSGDIVPSKFDISRRFTLHGLDVLKKERDRLKNIIKMRKDWLEKWYVPPSPRSDCYTCDANARNHNVRIEILNKCLDDYNEIILNKEKKTSVSSRTRSNLTHKQRPKLNLTRKSNIYRVDSVARRQKLAAMLAKKKEKIDRRKKISDMKKKVENLEV